MLPHRFAATLSCVAVSMLMACGGGGHSATPTVPPAPPPPPPFALLSSSPADGARDVARDTGFLATFSVAPDASSIGADMVQLLGPLGNPVPAALTVNGQELRLAPQVPALPGGTRFTVNLASTIKDGQARLLNTSYSRSFVTAAQSWAPVNRQVAELNYLTGGSGARLAVDASGNVMAAWFEEIKFIPVLFAARMDGASGNWSTPIEVYDVKSAGGAGGLGLVSDAKGNAYAFWTDYASSTRSILMARYVAATASWASPVPVPGLPAGMNPQAATIAVDGKGILTVVTRSDWNPGLYSTRFDPAGGGWSAPVEIQPSYSGSYIFNEGLVADAAGNLTLGWVQRGDINNGVNVARYDAKTGRWSAPRALDKNVVAQPLALAATPDGGATLAWTHGMMIMDTPSISATRFDPAAGTWSEPGQVSGDGDAIGARHPALVVDAAGVTTLVWEQSNAIHAARAGRAAPAWSGAERIGTANPGTDAFVLTADLAGNLTLLYSESGKALALRYSATEGKWETPVALGQPENGTAMSANTPAGVIDAAGNVTAVWFARVDTATTTRYPVLSNRFR
ncbi:Ig-like domain-containing protein [Telluria sp. B2]